MDATIALEMAVKPKLEDSFGKGIAMLIVVNAIQATEAPIVGLEREEYLKLVDAICSDERVKEVWGEAGTLAQKEEWVKLVE